jgi:hypothetical protein
MAVNFFTPFFNAIINIFIHSFLTYGRQKNVCMQLVSKVSFFTRFARAANFPSRKKKYYFTHLLHK